MSVKNKHAYLIVAHNQFRILEYLLKSLDDGRNDIYLHIDKKVKDFDKEYFSKLVKKANLYFVKRNDVGWGAYSQIVQTIELLKASTQKYEYSYYHLLSGVDMLLKKYDDVYNFFEEHKGYEFLTFDNPNKYDNKWDERIKYYWILQQHVKKNRLISIMNELLVKAQKVFGVNRIKNIDFKLQKGPNWFSITDGFARYVLSKEEWIKHYFKRSKCADELLLQTIIINSEFKEKLYKENKKPNMRYVDWDRGNPYIWRKDDYDELINADSLIARKFDYNKDKEIVEKLYSTFNS